MHCVLRSKRAALMLRASHAGRLDEAASYLKTIDVSMHDVPHSHSARLTNVPVRQRDFLQSAESRNTKKHRHLSQDACALAQSQRALQTPDVASGQNV
ncbi:hypothetical protein XAP6164_650001 [Xanthomonas phaseoli pv. phaseoli]|nr:hypothetical protein XAP6164_650001 [Xanthomonas phaseoli pv. phaseoli]